MVFELQEPFKSRYSKGYYRVSTQDNRARVDLFNSNSDRTTISYARYLMSVHLNRFLTEDEEVDHIDEDRTNDDLNNLQILSSEAHRIKTAKHKSRTYMTLECPQCGVIFEREKRQIKPNTLPKCSRRCNALYSWHSKK